MSWQFCKSCLLSLAMLPKHLQELLAAVQKGCVEVFIYSGQQALPTLALAAQLRWWWEFRLYVDCMLHDVPEHRPVSISNQTAVTLTKTTLHERWQIRSWSWSWNCWHYRDLLSHKDRDGKSPMWPSEPPFTNIFSVIPLHGEWGTWGDEQIAVTWQPKYTRCLSCTSSPMEESLRSRPVPIVTTGIEPSLYSEYCWYSFPGPHYWRNKSRKCVYLLYMCPIYNWTYHSFLFVLSLTQEKQHDYQYSLCALAFSTKLPIFGCEVMETKYYLSTYKNWTGQTWNMTNRLFYEAKFLVLKCNVRRPTLISWVPEYWLTIFSSIQFYLFDFSYFN